MSTLERSAVTAITHSTERIFETIDQLCLGLEMSRLTPDTAHKPQTLIAMSYAIVNLINGLNAILGMEDNATALKARIAKLNATTDSYEEVRHARRLFEGKTYNKPKPPEDGTIGAD